MFIVTSTEVMKTNKTIISHLFLYKTPVLDFTTLKADFLSDSSGCLLMGSWLKVPAGFYMLTLRMKGVWEAK